MGLQCNARALYTTRNARNMCTYSMPAGLFLDAHPESMKPCTADRWHIGNFLVCSTSFANACRRFAIAHGCTSICILWYWYYLLEPCAGRQSLVFKTHFRCLFTVLSKTHPIKNKKVLSNIIGDFFYYSTVLMKEKVSSSNSTNNTLIHKKMLMMGTKNNSS